MCITVKHRIDWNKPTFEQTRLGVLGLKCSISPGEVLIPQPSSWKGPFHEPLQLGEVGGPGPRGRSGCRLWSHIPEMEHWLCCQQLEVGFVTRAEILPDRLPAGQHYEETRPNVIAVASMFWCSSWHQTSSASTYFAASALTKSKGNGEIWGKNK